MRRRQIGLVLDRLAGVCQGLGRLAPVGKKLGEVGMGGSQGRLHDERRPVRLDGLRDPAQRPKGAALVVLSQGKVRLEHQDGVQAFDRLLILFWPISCRIGPKLFSGSG